MAAFGDFDLGWSALNSKEDQDDLPAVWILGQRHTLELDWREDFESLFWCSYRKDFPPFDPYPITSDAGWGCMLRAAQMLMCQGMKMHSLGRRWRPGTPAYNRRQAEYRAILRAVVDQPGAEFAFSVHNIVKVGLYYHDKLPGEWYGPTAAAYVLKELAQVQRKFRGSTLAVVVASDEAINVAEVRKAAAPLEPEQPPAAPAAEPSLPQGSLTQSSSSSLPQSSPPSPPASSAARFGVEEEKPLEVVEKEYALNLIDSCELAARDNHEDDGGRHGVSEDPLSPLLKLEDHDPLSVERASNPLSSPLAAASKVYADPLSSSSAVLQPFSDPLSSMSNQAREGFASSRGGGSGGGRSSGDGSGGGSGSGVFGRKPGTHGGDSWASQIDGKHSSSSSSSSSSRSGRGGGGSSGGCRSERGSGVSSSGTSSSSGGDGGGGKEKEWEAAVIILVPVRLGLGQLNEEYRPAVLKILELPQSIGIMGGSPNHAIYFVGHAGDGHTLLGLDPHTTQPSPLRPKNKPTPKPTTPAPALDPNVCTGEAAQATAAATASGKSGAGAAAGKELPVEVPPIETPSAETAAATSPPAQVPPTQVPMSADVAGEAETQEPAAEDVAEAVTAPLAATKIVSAQRGATGSGLHGPADSEERATPEVKENQVDNDNERVKGDDDGDGEGSGEEQDTETSFPCADDSFLESMHCKHVQRTSVRRVDPTLAFGFYCRDASDFEDLQRRLADMAPLVGGLRNMPFRVEQGDEKGGGEEGHGEGEGGGGGEVDSFSEDEEEDSPGCDGGGGGGSGSSVPEVFQARLYGGAQSNEEDAEDEYVLL